ncbi:nose resistant to fluoxetine protein 6 [Biomphalaria pfeifferi]|uniref:Nose resistant to fluoxetine protein 6 n=1 Tax=Biomphalaria pfeifferi TaxID=112525 RepID=A0AAD8B4U1_BIOPF|nr:nose resistant to fluoxetine protein 6 [Biomphalaria pfeifferi]
MLTDKYHCLAYLLALYNLHECRPRGTVTGLYSEPLNINKGDSFKNNTASKGSNKKNFPNNRRILSMRLKEEMDQFYSLPYNVTGTCLKHFQNISQGLERGELWALAFPDSNGVPATGAIKQKKRILGSFDQCESISQMVDDDDELTGRYTEMELVTALNTSPLQGIVLRWFVCVPRSCSYGDLDDVGKTFAETLNFDYINVVRREIENPLLDSWFWIAVVVLATLMCFAVLGTVVDCNDRMTLKVNTTKKGNKLRTDEIEDYNQSDNSAERRETERNGSIDSNKSLSARCTRINGRGLVKRILLSFSLKTNLLDLLKTESFDGDIRCLNGLRVLSMLWVILGHTANFLPEIKDESMKSNVMKHWLAYLLFNATYGVETFFFISGCLVSYLFIRNSEKLGHLKPGHLVAYYTHRYARLTPFFMVAMLIYTGLLPHVNSSPYSTISHGYLSCRRYWWRNLLYISNFFDYKEMCMTWSWYLPNDMQFYIIAPVFTLPIVYGCRKVSLLVAVLMVICHVGSTTVVIESHKDWSNGSYKKYMNRLYIKPWTRVAPYAIGLALGYILTVWTPNRKISRQELLIGWLVTSAIVIPMMLFQNGNFTIHYSVVANFNEINSRIYEIIKSPLWALFVAWIVFTCRYSNGGMIDSFLSWNGWMPLSKLSYGTYLCHLLVVLYINNVTPSDVHLTMSYIIQKGVSVMILAYSMSLVLSLLVDMPVRNLMRLT